MTQTADYTRTWTTVGTKAIGLRLEDGVLTEAGISAAIEALSWVDARIELPMIPALGIRAAISELQIPKVSLVAVSDELAPYGLYGIEGHYTNGRARVYVIDLGSEITPVASDFWPEEAQP